VPRSYLLSRYGLDDEEDQYGTGSYVAPTLGSPLLSRYGMNDSLTPEPFNPPQPTDTLTPQAWAEQEAQQPSFFNRSEVKGNAIGSGIAQGMYDIASAWNSWMGDDETAKLYSQLSGNLDHLAEQQSTGYVENTVRAVTRSLTMAAPTIGLGAAAGAAAVPALGVSAAAAGLIGLGTGTASLLALSVPVTGTEADMQADQLIEQGLMKPEDKTTFVHNEMKIEGVLTALFSAIPGAQGVQRAAMPAVKEASRSVAKEIFKMIGGELAEEELIAIGHNVNKMYHAFDPNRGTVSQLTQGIFDTAVQTILGAGVVGGANYGIRSYIDGEKQQTPVTDPTPTQQQGVIEPQPTPVVEDSPIAPSGIIQKKYQENDSLPPQPVRELSKQERIGNIELKDVQTAFPDANIYDTDEEGAIGWDVQTAQGNDIKIRFSEKFKLTDKQLDSWEESYGRKFTPEQRKRWKDGINKVNGINRIVVGEDGYTPGALIQLRLDTADKSTLLHEVGHFAWKNLYTKDEKNGLVKKYSDPSLPLRQQEEDVMQAIAKTGEVHSRVRDYIDHILYSIGLKDIDAGVARALIQSEKLWSRGAKPDTVIGADQLGRKSYATGTQQKQGVVGPQPLPTSSPSGEGLALESRAYHGTPHEFDKFTTEKIGTGEGAQVYGWGMYFAGNKEVAEFYKKKLGPGRGDKPADIAAKIWQSLPDEMPDDQKTESVIAELSARRRAGDDNPAFTQRMDEAIEATKAGKIHGRLYQVDLKPKDDEYLEWDKPLTEQSDKVKAALKRITPGDIAPHVRNRVFGALGVTKEDVARYQQQLDEIHTEQKALNNAPEGEFDRKRYDYLESKRDRVVETLQSDGLFTVGTVDGPQVRMDDNTNVEWLYREIAKGRGTHERAADRWSSEYLKGLGIRGIKYLDQSSRIIGETGRQNNYVIFSDEDVEIEAVTPPPQGQLATSEFAQQLYDRDPEAVNEYLGSAPTVKALEKLTGYGRAKLPTTQKEREKLQSMLEFSRDADSKDEQKARRKEARLKRMEQTGIPSSDPMYQAIAALDVDGPKAANAPDALKKMGIEKLFGLDPTSQTMVAEGMTGKQVSALSNTRIKTLFRIKDGTALGAAVEYGDNDNAIFMNKKTLRDQDIYNRVLGHESGHVLANLKVGDDTMMSAIFDIQGTMPDLDKQIEILTQADKAAAAKLGYSVDETQQGLFEEGKAVPNAEEQKYLDLRDDLFYAFKKKATNLRVRFTEGEYDEATKLSLLIRSFNPRMAGKAQLKDRYSIHEVYADAMTVFFNAPEVIQENARMMWKRINEAIAHKQEFLGKYIEIQAAMNGESSKLAKLQSDFIKGRIKDPGDALRYHMHNRMKQKDDYNYRFLDSLLKAFIDKTTPATSHLNDVELQAYIKSRLEQFGHASFRVVKEFKPLDDRIQNLGMDSDDVSLMMVGEVVKARSQMEGDLEVFTGGATEEMFNRNEQEMIKKYGEAKVSQLKSIIQERNEKTFIPALRTLNKIGEISDEAMQSIEESSPWYSPLLSQHHLQETGYVSGGLQQMTGDLGDKVDPHVGSLLKAMSAAEYAERRSAQNRAVRTKVAMLGLETVNSTDKPQKPAGYGMKWIQEYLPDDKGRMVKQWVMMDKVDAESIYGTPRSDMDMKVTKLNNIMYRFFYPLLLTFRGAYMPRQFSKDIFRTLKNAPAMVAGQTGEKFSTTKFLMNLPKAARLAKDTVYGTRELPSEVSDLIAKGHIDPVVNDYVTRLHMLADEDIDRQRTITEIMERGGYRLHDKQHQIAVNKKLTKLQKAERFMNNLANFQNMTVKIAGAMEVERAFNGRTPETAAWITQNFVGTPNLNQRSDLSGALNLASFFSRVALTGIKADLMAFKNSKSTAEYAKNWMAYAAMPKLLKYAALYGLLGEAMKQMWESIPEYERDKQNAIPFGLVVDTDGKTKALYLSLFPSDPMGAVFDSMLDQFVRFYADGKDQGNREGVMDEFGKVMEAFYQAQPLTSWNTPLQIYNVWGSFLRNENPRDPFFNNEIVTDEDRRKGVWASTQPMIRWTTSKFGAPSEYASGLLDALLGPLYPSVTETPKTKNLLGFIPVPVTAQGMLGAIPGVGQLVKISDRGIQEDIYELNSIQRDEEMWARDNMDKTSRDLTVLKERLSNEMAMGKVSPERRKKLAVYKVWESEAYTPLRAQAMEAHEAGDDKEAKRILGILKERSEQVKQGVELPEFAMSRVLIKLTDTPEEQRAATKSRKLGITVEPDQRAIDEKNNLKALLVAKQMPEIEAINYLRAGYISRMNDEQLYKVARQVGVTRTGLKSQVVAGVVNSKYSPETFKNGKLTAYGERVRRLKQLLK
jgi:hypothetical protein